MKVLKKYEKIGLIILVIIWAFVAAKACKEEYDRGFVENPTAQDTDNEQLEELRSHHPNAILFE